MQTDEGEAIAASNEVIQDEEMLERGLPFSDYAKDSEKLREMMAKLEKAYDAREKIIDHIMQYGTGIESEKALRMYSTATLQKWDTALEEFRAEGLKEK